MIVSSIFTLLLALRAINLLQPTVTITTPSTLSSPLELHLRASMSTHPTALIPASEAHTREYAASFKIHTGGHEYGNTGHLGVLIWRRPRSPKIRISQIMFSNWNVHANKCCGQHVQYDFSWKMCHPSALKWLFHAFHFLFSKHYVYHIVMDNKVSWMWIHTALSYTEVGGIWMYHQKKQHYQGTLREPINDFNVLGLTFIAPSVHG